MQADTSRAALESVEESGGRVDGCKRVMLFLHRYPNESFTRAEIARGTGMKLQTVCARVRDLLDESYPKIYELPARPCKVGGNASKPLRIAEPKAAPAPVQVSTGMLPVAAEQLIQGYAKDKNGKDCPLPYVAVGFSPGWPPDQDNLHRKYKAAA